MIPICFVEDECIRKSLTGQVTLYYLKRDTYVNYRFFSEIQKLKFSVNYINFDLHKTQVSDVHVTNLFQLMKLFWTFINKGNKWCGILGRGNELSVSDDWIAGYARGQAFPERFFGSPLRNKISLESSVIREEMQIMEVSLSAPAVFLCCVGVSISAS